MKVAQTECEKIIARTSKLPSEAREEVLLHSTSIPKPTSSQCAAVKNIAATTTSTAPEREAEEATKKTEATVSESHFLENNENVACDSNAAAAIKLLPTATTTNKMTDERFNNINNPSSKNSNNNLIAETAKILLNGFNGSLLSAATFQLPGPPPTLPTTLTSSSTTVAPVATIVRSKARNRSPHCTAASANNGTVSSSSSYCFTSSLPQVKGGTKVMATAESVTLMETAPSATRVGTPPTIMHDDENRSADSGVIDYTISGMSSASQQQQHYASLTFNQRKTRNSSNNNSNSNDIGRNPTSFVANTKNGNGAGCGNGSGGVGYSGGRLQFFKDGKFILELARSKDGVGKGGWISVPRKPYRAPLATSSTLTTPISATAYPKNESSTSLSFSDDNSSIQSSPWQRDHCWKQAAPRRGISTEMSLLYQRPKGVTLRASAQQAAHKKRRRPYDVSILSTEKEIFELVDNRATPVAAACRLTEKLQAAESETGQPAVELDVENGVGTANAIDEDATPTPSPPLTSQQTNSDDLTEIKLAEQKQDDHIKSKLNEATCSEEKDELMPIAEEQMKPNSMTEPKTDVEKEENKATKAGEEKRLKKQKNRVKFTEIIQKLIDRMPTRPAQKTLKTSTAHHGTSVGPASGNSNIMYHNNSSSVHKASPPSSAAAATSRLVVEYHQQHVSPRKRILREFEKVSLEDNAAVGGASGGKRSRAKGSSNSTATNLQRLPQTVSVPTSTTTTTLSKTHALNGNHNSIAKSTKTTAPATTAAAPTRLYSSYSINSLLGSGGSSTSSAAAATGAALKRTNDQAVVSSAHQQQLYTDPSYLRAMLASPKSPTETFSINASKRRSPTFAASSPHRYDSHSRSPTIFPHAAHNEHQSRTRSPRSTPPDVGYRTHFNAEHNEAAQMLKSQAQQQQQHHQAMYSPYMMSPKYVPPPASPTNCSNYSGSTSRSPSARQTNLYNSALSPSVPALMHHQQHHNIPNTSSMDAAAQRDFSPPQQRALSSTPLREAPTTPRTVPKKTASIRRQFAGTNSSSSSNNNTGGCSSPADRAIEESSNTIQQLQADRQTPTHFLARSSPSSCASGGVSALAAAPAPSVASPLHYYMYPPNSAAAANAMMSPAAYYHPYISTLAALRHNSMWMHHYAGGGVLPQHHHAAAPPPTARLSPAFHHSFPYNGIATVAAAAAAAAAGFGGDAHSAAAHHLSQGAAGVHHMLAAPHHQQHHHPPTGRMHSPKMTDNTAHSSSDAKSLSSSSSTANATAAATSYARHNVKEELSSDVPLNLSKH